MRTIGISRTPYLRTNHFSRKLSKCVYSFDLFDTVLSRKTGTPKGIFCIMRELLTKQAQLEKNGSKHFMISAFRQKRPHGKMPQERRSP